ATAICNTFCTDSSVVLVPRHRREVCPLARQVMLPILRAQPVSTPLQSGIRFFPPPYPHCPWLALWPPYLTWRSNMGLPRSARLGIHVRRDSPSSIAYSEKLDSFAISATFQSTDRHHGIVGQKSSHFQR